MAFTQAVSVTGPVKMVYIGGQNAVDQQGNIVGKGDVRAQTQQVLENIEKVLTAAGARPEHIIKWTVLLVQGCPLQPGFEAFQRFWGEPSKPANHFDVLCRWSGASRFPARNRCCRCRSSIGRIREVGLLLKDCEAIVNTHNEQKEVYLYEPLREQRVVGQTKKAGFQIGVRRTIAVSVEDAWAMLTSAEGLGLWLGAPLQLEPGASYQASDGATGTVSVVNPEENIRLTWLPRLHWPRASIVQVRVIPNGAKTVISFHQEHLPGPFERARMREHWTKVLDALQASLGKNRESI
jgi:enamine deaminase RidA (YjgF/YER057c/UK114 family)/uncharacterized protein YndB with AHSA1/START domain